MAGFENNKGSDRGSKERTIASLTLARGDLLDYDRANAKLVAATSASTPESIAGVVTAPTVTADTVVNIEPVVEYDEYVVDAANNSNSAHNYQRMVLTDSNTVNNTGTDDTSDAAVVTQVGVVGATGDKKIIVEFVTRQDRA